MFHPRCIYLTSHKAKMRLKVGLMLGCLVKSKPPEGWVQKIIVGIPFQGVFQALAINPALLPFTWLSKCCLVVGEVSSPPPEVNWLIFHPPGMVALSKCWYCSCYQINNKNKVNAFEKSWLDNYTKSKVSWL